MTASERTGWRDVEISGRHRRWGFNCPAVDLDFLMVEYHLGVPVAIVEYKHHNNHEGESINFNHATYRALGGLVDAATGKPLPFIVARYWPENWSFRVKPVNDRAAELLRRTGWSDMSERTYVSMLYWLRNLRADDTVLRNLNTTPPPFAEVA